MSFIIFIIINVFDVHASQQDVTRPVGYIYELGGSILYGDSTNKDFYYSATDIGGSGVSYIEYKEPNDTIWRRYGDAEIISKNSINGKYTFRAVDNFGNISVESYVYLDTVAPVGRIYTYNQELTNGSVTNASYIYFEATDEMSGLNNVYVKTPNSSYYMDYTNNSYLHTSGTYYFYATDYAGNVSKTYSITINNLPKVQIIKNIENNTVYLTWTDDSYQVTVNGQNYQKGHVIFEEGSYVVEIIDSNGNRGSDYFAISHLYKLIEVVDPTCYMEGYSLYECITCKEQKYADIKEIVDHDFTRMIIDPTCESSGYTILICNYCFWEEVSDMVDALGHSYEEITKKVDCINNGGVFLKCSRCNLEKGIEVIEALGHDYKSVVLYKSLCVTSGIRRFICIRCNYILEEEIPALNHQYILLKEKIYDNRIEQEYKCTNCGYLFNKTINKEENNITLKEIIEHQKIILITLLIITSGIWSLFMGIKLIFSVKQDDKLLAKKQIFNYIIGLIIIFIIIAICPLIIKVIEILK